MKKQLIAILLAMVLTMSVAFAIDPAGAAVTSGSAYGPLTAPAAGTEDVTAGYIQEANLDTNQSTLRWAGLTGNVSGNIQLGDGASVDVMYTWVAEGNIVYASEDATPTWASLDGAAAADIDTANAHLTASDSDSGTNTFTAGSATDIGSSIFADFSTGADSASTLGGAGWTTYVLTDGADLVYAGIVADQANFRGDTADFQMIVPEDGVDEDVAATTYSLWVELI